MRVRPEGGRAVNIIIVGSHCSKVVVLQRSVMDGADRQEVCFLRGPWPSCVYTLLRKDGTNR